MDEHATEILVVQGDLTQQAVDVIVNAANESLAHGGGVALAIVRAGGPVVQEESDEWVRTHGPVGRGGAAVTTAGAMPARFVIHVVGPRYREGQDNEGMLRDAVVAALDAAIGRGARTIAFPAISAGIFGYPLAAATDVLVQTVIDWVQAHATALDEVRLVGFSADVAGAFEAALDVR